MKQLRKRFDLFCMRNRRKGIPNLMLYICIGNAIVYLMSSMSQNNLYWLYSLLVFDKTKILQGEVWRLISYPLTMYNSSVLLMFISLFCYYSLGQFIEHQWGTCRFNLFYFSGILLTDVYAMVMGGRPDAYYLNMSLFISFATLFPDAQFLLYFIVPIKAWIFAIFNLVIVLIGVFSTPFPDNLIPLVSLLNYFLFFGLDIINILPTGLRYKAARALHRTPAGRPNVIQFRQVQKNAPAQEPAKQNYTHKCTVCGRTDVSHPNLEFRYCSKCKGYHCYCEDHISSHAHIQ